MTRVAKKPQFEAFNNSYNCYGRFQRHDSDLADWRRPETPLMLEIGAGTARISRQFSLDHPDWQVIALDRKSDRLHKAARRTLDQANLVFLQADLADLDDHLDLEKQVSLLWLAFPDPYPTGRQAKHRLTSLEKLAFYGRILHPRGRLRFKTDSRNLFRYTLDNLERAGYELVEAEKDLQRAGYENWPPDVQTVTRYEARFLKNGLPIYYLEAELRH